MGLNQSLAVGLGEPKHAEHWCGRLAPSIPCFADTTNEAFYTFGLRQGTTGEALQNAFGIAVASAKALTDGFTQGRATGDANMLPGTFIIDQKGVIQYAYYSAFAGDDPDIAELTEAMKSDAFKSKA